MTDLKQIAIHGVPRSGTSWVGEILNSSPFTIYKYQPLFSYALKDYLTPASSPERIQSFFHLLAETSDEFMDRLPERRQGKLPVFSKQAPTHVVYKEVRYHHILENLLGNSPDTRLVAVIRNPLAVIGSWASAPREFRIDQGWVLSREWRHAELKNGGRPEEYFGFEKWKEATRLFLRLESQFPGQVYVLRYESLVQSPAAEVDRVFGFCGLELSGQTSEFLAESTRSENSDTYSVYRAGNTTEKWKTVLSKEIADSIVRETRAAELGQFLT